MLRTIQNCGTCKGFSSWKHLIWIYYNRVVLRSDPPSNPAPQPGSHSTVTDTIASLVICHKMSNLLLKYNRFICHVLVPLNWSDQSSHCVALFVSKGIRKTRKKWIFYCHKITDLTFPMTLIKGSNHFLRYWARVHFGWFFYCPVQPKWKISDRSIVFPDFGNFQPGLRTQRHL